VDHSTLNRWVLAYAPLIERRLRLGEMDMTETEETEWPPHLEALVAASANHRLLHEDDEVRVLEVTVQPGERENLLHHRWPSCLKSRLRNGPSLRFPRPRRIRAA
jgi:hypothetical protein